MFLKKESIDTADATPGLYKNYISSFSKLSEYYSGDYRDIDSFSSLVKKNNIPREQRFSVSNILKRYNEECNYSEEVLSNIEKLKSQKCFTIITGQQPSLLTGPLYTIYKAISAIKLSEHLDDYFKGDYSFVPIFWVASEDHDLGEVNKFVHQDTNGNLSTSSLNIKYNGETLDRLDIKNELDSFLKDLQFPQTEFSHSLFELLHYSNKETFAKHFVYLLSSFFKNKGLIIVEPHLFRKTTISLNKLFIDKRIEITDALRKTSLSLEKNEYKTQIDYNSILNDKWSMLFYLDGNKRKKIYYNKDNVHIDNATLSYDALSKKMENEAKNFSHSVALRPIVQDTILPNIATIAGPGEIAYFAQLKDIYSICKRKMPIIYPRITVSLIEKKIARIKERFALSAKEIINNNINYEKINTLTSALKAKENLETFTAQMKNLLNSIANEAKKQGNDVGQSINPSIKKIEYEIGRLTQRFIKKCENKEGISQKQIQKLKNALLPKEKPQERIFNIFSYENLYGKNTIEEIIKNTDIKNFSHQVLYYE